MEIEAFLDYDTLRYSDHKGESGLKSTLFGLAERHEIHNFFRLFDLADSDLLRDLRRDIRTILQKASAQPHLQRHVSDRKVAEIAGIGHYSGIVTEPLPVHIYDTCAGTGILAHLISRLRGEHARTTADCIESRSESVVPFEHLRNIFALGNPGIRFEHGTVQKKAFMPHPGRSTYVLAKHACGDTVTGVIEGFSRSLPRQATLLTCCHGKSRETPPNAARAGVSPEEWRLLVKIADWTSSSDEEKKIIGRVAMRIMDGLRIIGLSSEIQACVREVANPHMSVKNQAICLVTL